MEAARLELERMRGSSAVWQELRYERATGPHGYECDANAVPRAKVLWALQYDRRPDDLALVRWLAAQETQCRREAPFSDPADEDPLTWVERATFAGRPELARAELNRWAAGRERDKGTLSTIRYRLADLGDFAEAARAQRESLAFAETAWDTASACQDLAAEVFAEAEQRRISSSA